MAGYGRSIATCGGDRLATMTDREAARKAAVVVFVVAAVTAILAVCLAAANALLLFFGGIIIALLLHRASKWVSGKLHIRLDWALAMVVLGLTCAIAALCAVLVPRFVDQVARLQQELPKSLQTAADAIRGLPGGSLVSERLSNPDKLIPGGKKTIEHAFGFLSSLTGMVGAVAIVAFLGIYLAARPSPYVNGTARLFPVHQRTRVADGLRELGHTLSKWALGRMLVLAVDGIGVGIGLAILGVPLAFSLGIITAVASIVPNIGPVISVIPAVLLALPQGGMKVLWVMAIYAGVQAIETFVLTPIVQKREVQIPPAMLLLVQLIMGKLTGLLGLLLATPLLVTVLVLVDRFYIHDLLEKDVET